MSEQLGTVLYYLFKKLKKDKFIEFLEENYCDFEQINEHINRLLSTAYHEEYLNFEFFVELAIKTLKPDYDGKVYVKYNNYYTVTDDEEESVYPLNQTYEHVHLSQVPELMKSLSIDLADEEVELVLSVLSSGDYELSASDQEGNDVEISIKEPKLHNPYQDSYNDED